MSSGCPAAAPSAQLKMGMSETSYPFSIVRNLQSKLKNSIPVVNYQPNCKLPERICDACLAILEIT